MLQEHDENNNTSNGIFYKQEKDYGTQLTSINLSGSQALETNGQLHSWQTLAHLKGWQGVWEPAKVTENNNKESL
eukprot:8032039-Heterocapsa_arctica.AAC.1